MRLFISVAPLHLDKPSYKRMYYTYIVQEKCLISIQVALYSEELVGASFIELVKCDLLVDSLFLFLSFTNSMFF